MEITPDFRLEAFCRAVAKSYRILETEMQIAYSDSRDASMVEYVIRMLTMPELNDSDWILESIMVHREHYATAGNAAEE